MPVDPSPKEIKKRLMKAAGVSSRDDGPAAANDLPARVRHDLLADEDDPSRYVPSAEGVVTFAGLSEDVRDWVGKQLLGLRARTNGGTAARKANGGNGGHAADERDDA